MDVRYKNEKYKIKLMRKRDGKSILEKLDLQGLI